MHPGARVASETRFDFGGQLVETAVEGARPDRLPDRRAGVGESARRQERPRQRVERLDVAATVRLFFDENERFGAAPVEEEPRELRAVAGRPAKRLLRGVEQLRRILAL